MTAQAVNERASCKDVEWCCVMAFSEGVRDPAQLRVVSPVQAGEEAPAAAGTVSLQAAGAGEQAGTSHEHPSRSEDAPGQFCTAVHMGLCVCHGTCPQT